MYPANLIQPKTKIDYNNLTKPRPLYDVVVLSFNLTPLFYDISYDGIENIPKEGPAVLLPKHQCYSDSVILGVMTKKRIGRYLNFLMKSTLPDWIERFGTTKIMTPSEYRELSKRIGNREAREKCEEINRHAFEVLEDVLKKGELSLIFPEGKLSRQEMGHISVGTLKKVYEIQKEIPEQIPLIPIGIEYEWLWKGKYPLPPNKISIRIGEPMFFSDSPLEKLCEQLSEDIKRLSNLE